MNVLQRQLGILDALSIGEGRNFTDYSIEKTFNHGDVVYHYNVAGDLKDFTGDKYTLFADAIASMRQHNTIFYCPYDSAKGTTVRLELDKNANLYFVHNGIIHNLSSGGDTTVDFSQYMPLSGASLTGNIGLLNNTRHLIQVKWNGDIATGTAVAFGSEGTTAIVAGDIGSQNVGNNHLVSLLPENDESVYLVADGGVNFRTGCATGYDAGKLSSLSAAGYLTLASGLTANGTITATGGFKGNITGNVTGNASTATTATKLGTATVGNATTPIYLNGGTATACSSSLTDFIKHYPNNAYTDLAKQPANSVVNYEGTGKSNTPEGNTSVYCAGTSLIVGNGNVSGAWNYNLNLYAKWNDQPHIWFGTRSTSTATMSWYKIAHTNDATGNVGSYTRPAYLNAGTVTVAYNRTYSTAAASGGANGDIWYQYI